MNDILKQVYQGYFYKNISGDGIIVEELKSVYNTEIRYNKVNIVGLFFLEEISLHGIHVYYAGLGQNYCKNIENGLLGKYNHDDIEETRFFHRIVDEAHLMGIQC